MVSVFFLSYGSSATRSSGSSSLTMNSSTQSSFRWYSGSVSKSHTASDATANPLVKRERLIWQSMTIHARPGHKADVSELSHALGRAFYDDPVSVWIMPDPKARAANLRRFFATVPRHPPLAGGGVEVATDGSTIGAAALWDPPGRWKQSGREQLMMLPSFLLGFGPRLTTGRKLGPRIEQLKSQHPEAPPWY